MTRAGGADEAAERCPLCGGPNDCAMAAGDTDAPCWCVAETFPLPLVERVGEEERGRRCICRSCLEAETSGAGSAGA